MKKHLMKNVLLLLILSVSTYMCAQTGFKPTEKIFTDASCSQIKKGVTQSDINKIPNDLYKGIANAIKNGTYDNTGFRIQSYRPYQKPIIKADENFCESYSEHDNPTGIYATKEGEVLQIFVGDTHGKELSVMIQEIKQNKEDPYGPYSNQEYELKEGLNEITTTQPGLLYIKYLVDESVALNPENAQQEKEIKDLSININIAGGAVNGYYNKQKHSLDDWKRILAYEAGSKGFDLMGDKVHLTWVKQDYRDMNMTDPTPLLGLWDTILVHQHHLMGLEKYKDPSGKNRVFQNRMYIHLHPGNPGASRSRITFPYKGYNDIFTEVSSLRNRIWGPAHEMGHVNQMRPGLNWGGMIETTNNIYCVYTQKTLGQETRLTANNYYEEAKAKIRDAYKADPTRMDLGFSSIKGDFEKIVPFWQLYLYMLVNGNEDFFADLMEQYRLLGVNIPGAEPGTTNKNAVNKDHGLLQLFFVEQACIAAGMDLREFFTEWGFIRITDVTYNQYRERHLVVTQERIDALNATIDKLNLPKPTVKIWDINDDNYEQYKDSAVKLAKKTILPH